MKLVKMVMRVDDDFKPGMCKKCPISEHLDSFGEQACCEGECENDDTCPLRFEENLKE